MIIDSAHFESADDPGPETPDAGNAAKKLEETEIREIIMDKVSELPENQRIIFTMREIDGCSHREIAQVLDLSEGNVRTLFHRAKDQLKKAIERSVRKFMGRINK